MLAGQRDPAKAEPAPAPEPAPEGKPVEAKASEPEPDAVEGSEDAEAPATEPVEAQPPDLKAFAKSLGVSPSELVIDEDGSIGFKTKVDGIEGKAKLSDLRKSFQLEAAHNRRLMEVSEQRKAFEAERERAASELRARAQQTDQYLSLAQQELMGELHNTDWASLRATDPIEYLTRKNAYEERVAKLNQALAQRAAEQKAAQDAAHKAEQARLAKEDELLTNAIPAFADKAAKTKAQKQIVEMLKADYGFDDNDLKAVATSNHRALRILYDLAEAKRELAELKQARAKAIEKVEAAPKMAKAGSAATQDSEARKIQQLRTAVKKGSKTAGPEWLKRTVLARTKQR